MNPGEKAVPGRRLFLGHAGPGAQAAWRVAHPCVGYSGGDVPNATYRNHGTTPRRWRWSSTPTQTSFRDLLEFFFRIHDPEGTRGARAMTAAVPAGRPFSTPRTSSWPRRGGTIADVNASGLWPGKVVTELAPAGPFWEAEPEHPGLPGPSTPTATPATTPCGLEAAATRDRLTANAQERWGSARQWASRPGVSVFFPEEMVMQSRCIQQAPSCGCRGGSTAKGAAWHR